MSYHYRKIARTFALLALTAPTERERALAIRQIPEQGLNDIQKRYFGSEISAAEEIEWLQDIAYGPEVA